MNIISQADGQIGALVQALNAGQTIVYPTETCYGLGCQATNSLAVETVFAIKGRERTKSVLMVADDVNMVKKYATWNATAERLAAAYWPGPLTMVLAAKAQSGLAPGVVGESGSVAFRVTAYSWLHELVHTLGSPLVSTSANLAGGVNPYRVSDILGAFAENSVQPDLIIDAGELPSVPPSTVVRVSGNAVEIIRQGELYINIE